MPKAFIEKLYGEVNGINQTFETAKNFIPGSVKVFVNGLVLEASMDDGWVELGVNRVRMKIAPIPGDVLQAYFMTV